jgi:biotin synthase
MQLFSCCEPIGPEHSTQEIVDGIFLGLEYESIQQSAMRRSMVPGSPATERGQISQLRLAQIVAVIALASVSFPQVMAVACHEPNLLGLMAGANVVGAEVGANPRDEVADTAENRGLSMNDCRRMLFEAGFTSVFSGDYSQIPLNVDYLRKVGAI